MYQSLHLKLHAYLFASMTCKIQNAGVAVLKVVMHPTQIWINFTATIPYSLGNHIRIKK